MVETTTTVLIVGAGPSGLATSACLSRYSIPHIILEKEDYYGSLWKKKAYDRLNLHLAKEFCSLPLMQHDQTTPKFMSKDTFVSYLDDYVDKFGIKPCCFQSVESAAFDESDEKWRVESRSCVDGLVRVFVADFLVVASGENSCAFVPGLKGLDSFGGEIIHSSEYKSGSKYKGKDVLVVGCGNSGMEISLDLSDFGARTSMVVRSAFHVLTKEMVYLAMMLLRYLPVSIVDRIIIFLAYIEFGNLSKIGIRRPSKGPFALKYATGKTPVIDNGTVKKILSGDIKVVQSEILNINGKQVEFKNGLRKSFDAIVFATGYKSRANTWLKDFMYVLNEEGMPKNAFPRHWKGDKKIYCAGLAGKGLPGVAADAKAIADDINNVLSANYRYSLLSVN